MQLETQQNTAWGNALQLVVSKQVWVNSMKIFCPPPHRVQSIPPLHNWFEGVRPGCSATHPAPSTGPMLGCLFVLAHLVLCIKESDEEVLVGTHSCCLGKLTSATSREFSTAAPSEWKASASTSPEVASAYMHGMGRRFSHLKLEKPAFAAGVSKSKAFNTSFTFKARILPVGRRSRQPSNRLATWHWAKQNVAVARYLDLHGISWAGNCFPSSACSAHSQQLTFPVERWSSRRA